MTLSRLDIQSLRNLERVKLSPSPRTNLIYGENGSGKTSVLEAVHTLALGRSFRSHKHKPLIQWEKDQFVVFAEIEMADRSVPVGLRRARNGEVALKVDGRPVSSLAELASVMPLQIIDAHTFMLLEGSPKVRRQFMDWLVFHVEHSFFPAWKGVQRCLKQRNSLLRRDRIDFDELRLWDRELCQLSQRIHENRTTCVELFEPVFLALLDDFIKLPDVTLSYQRGWDKNKPYDQVLADNFERDRQIGYTQSGSHRADLRIQVQGQPAADVLSRGQQKLVVCALKIAQGVVFNRQTQGRCIYLVDDLPAELDISHRAKLVEWLDTLETQVFITGVEMQPLLADWKDRPAAVTKVFHVEQGRVVEEPTSASSQ
ncbi:DNA replication/repair protein RecF [Marinimicrobium sp. ARAG 43.8]|uniref:DNA replication/repair protein RecF n=1 Tax=Marinimicrobium sp. ARAG 43.8 TaxID=3418719 RepID=UPI003CF21D41